MIRLPSVLGCLLTVSLAGPAALAAAPLQSYSTGSFTLAQGSSLAIGDLTLTMQSDGDLVLSQGNVPLWSTGTGDHDCGNNQCRAVFQPGGDFIVYDGVAPLWTTQTEGHPGATLLLSAAAPFLKVQASNDSILWASSYTFTSLTLPENAVIDFGNDLSLAMQSDGNLVLRQGVTAIWYSDTVVPSCGNHECQTIFQADGNFVVYNGSTPLWNSQTEGNPGAQLALTATAPYIQIQNSYGVTISSIDLATPGSMIAVTPQTVKISTTPRSPISPQLFGTNYDWNYIPATGFSAFNSMMENIGVTLMRYPGGWNAEHYDWANNTETSWAHYKAGGPAGVDPTSLLSLITVPADFILPSEPAVKDATQIPSVLAQSVDIVTQYGSKVQAWEIGNEWWNQGEAQKDPNTMAANFKNYAALVAAVAPALKKINPSITVYATLDWTQPDDFKTFPTLVGPEAWAAVDGISIHSYCGTDPTLPLCSSLPSVVSKLESATGKTKIFASEWAASRNDNTSNNESFGLPNSNVVALAIQDMANAGVTAATYWPPSAEEIPQIAFASDDYGRQHFDGTLFSWMAKHYTGSTLTTEGYESSIASVAPDGNVTVFIPTMGAGLMNIQIPLAGTGLSRVVSAEVLYSANPEDDSASLNSLFATLPTQIVSGSAGPAVSFVLNPGTAGRGANWEIARVTLAGD